MSEKKPLATPEEERKVDSGVQPRLAVLRNPAVRWAVYIGLFLVGFVLYWLSDLLLEGVIGSLVSWLIVVVMAVFAFVVWVRDERRLARDVDDA